MEAERINFAIQSTYNAPPYSTQNFNQGVNKEAPNCHTKTYPEQIQSKPGQVRDMDPWKQQGIGR